MVFTSDDEKNRCMKCDIDMGESNPRQLCGKLFCLKERIDEGDEEVTDHSGGDGKDASTDDDNEYDDTVFMKTSSSQSSRKRSSTSANTSDAAPISTISISSPTKKKKKDLSAMVTAMPSFLSTEQFTEIVENSKPMKWADLDCKKVFRVLNLEEVTFYDVAEGKEKLSKYAEMMDASGEKVNVWLPSIVDRKLSSIDSVKIARGSIFIRALGLQISRKTGRKYHNFEIAKAEKFYKSI